jgi:hypothetical protein
MLVMSSVLLLAILVVGAIMLDGGLSFQREREAQAQTDAVARAGLVELGRGSTDTTIWQAVLAAASERGITIEKAEYTDDRGARLGTLVGPNDGDGVPDAAGGIHLLGRTRIDGFLAPVLEFTSFEIHTRATALADGG